MLKNICIIFLLFLLASCQAGMPEAQKKESTPIPTPEAGMGVLYGKLIDSTTDKPYEAALFLSRNLTAEHPGYPPFISFSYQTDPRALQKADGSFVFMNIKPGKYVLTISQPHTTDYYVKKNDVGEKELIMFEVIADQTVDLGTLEYP